MAIQVDLTTYAGAFMPQQYCKVMKVTTTKTRLEVELGIHINAEQHLPYEVVNYFFDIDLTLLDTINPIAAAYDKLKEIYPDGIKV